MIGLALFSTLSTYGRGLVPLNHAAIPAKTDDDDFLFFIFYFALIKKMTNKGVEYIEQPHNTLQEFITMYCTVHVLVLGRGVPPSFWTEDPDVSAHRHTVTVEPKATLGQHRSGRGGVISKVLHIHRIVCIL